MHIRSIRILLVLCALALVPLRANRALAQAQSPVVAAVPPNSTIVLHDSAIAFQELILNDNSTVAFAPNLTAVNITVVKLTLNGRSTITLTPIVPIPSQPPAQPGQGQAPNVPSAPQNGARGLGGLIGGNGTPGISLNMSVQQLDAANGSLWIKTDGTSGGPGGDGGGGGKGSSGQQTCISNPDGGAGGGGGDGGSGGRGGNTAKISLKIGPNTITPTQAQGVAPSSRPAAADVPGTIVIAGSPGAGGPGGLGGPGGPGGEGHQSHFPCPTTDSNGGAPGRNGNHGQTGPPGTIGQ